MWWGCGGYFLLRSPRKGANSQLLSYNIRSRNGNRPPETCSVEFILILDRGLHTFLPLGQHGGSGVQALQLLASRFCEIYTICLACPP